MPACAYTHACAQRHARGMVRSTAPFATPDTKHSTHKPRGRVPVKPALLDAAERKALAHRVARVIVDHKHAALELRAEPRRARLTAREAVRAQAERAVVREPHRVCVVSLRVHKLALICIDQACSLRAVTHVQTAYADTLISLRGRRTVPVRTGSLLNLQECKRRGAHSFADRHHRPERLLPEQPHRRRHVRDDGRRVELPRRRA